MSTYLQLVQQLYRELSLSGTVPTSVTGQTAEKRSATRWIAEADYAIQCLWTDWRFLWSQHSTGTVVDQTDYTKPSDIGNYDLESFYIDYTSDDYVQLDYISYHKWRELYRNGTHTASEPELFTIKPDNTIVLYPKPDSGSYTLTADYWKTPTKMTADSDTSDIPVRFERAILERAKMIYAEERDDKDVLGTSALMYTQALKLLEDAELPERYERLSNQDPLVVVVE